MKAFYRQTLIDHEISIAGDEPDPDPINQTNILGQITLALIAVVIVLGVSQVGPEITSSIGAVLGQVADAVASGLADHYR